MSEDTSIRGLRAFVRACGGIDGSVRSTGWKWLKDLAFRGVIVGNVLRGHSMPTWRLTDRGREMYRNLHAAGKGANLCRYHVDPRPECRACRCTDLNLPPCLAQDRPSAPAEIPPEPLSGPGPTG